MDAKIKGWKIVKTTINGQEYIQSATLKEGPTQDNGRLYNLA